jgi:hypothetical protein
LGVTGLRRTQGKLSAFFSDCARPSLKGIGQDFSTTYTGWRNGRVPLQERAMSLCSFEGESGRYYDYSVLEFKNRAAFPIGGGNYVFTRLSGGALEVVCVGETDNMWSVFVSTTLWDRAKREYGATTPYIHSNPDPKARRLECEDIARRYRPPMNEEPARKTGS